MYLDSITYLPDDILCKVDRASMWHGLEVRIPYLDKNIYNLSWKIPHHQKISNGKGKIILRNLLKKYIPDDLILKNKKGFGIPIGDLIKSELRDWSENLLQKSKITNNNINYEKINKIWKEHLSGNFNHQHKIWNLLMLQAFMEK
jgi:Asparagine synthase (glutamine-hydrolyzing)